MPLGRVHPIDCRPGGRSRLARGDEVRLAAPRPHPRRLPLPLRLDRRRGARTSRRCVASVPSEVALLLRLDAAGRGRPDRSRVARRARARDLARRRTSATGSATAGSIAAIVLWALSGALGRAGRDEPMRHVRELAERLAEDGDRPSERAPPRSPRPARARDERARSFVRLIAILVLMVWKPGPDDRSDRPAAGTCCSSSSAMIARRRRPHRRGRVPGGPAPGLAGSGADPARDRLPDEPRSSSCRASSPSTSSATCSRTASSSDGRARLARHRLRDHRHRPDRRRRDPHPGPVLGASPHPRRRAGRVASVARDRAAAVRPCRPRRRDRPDGREAVG